MHVENFITSQVIYQTDSCRIFWANSATLFEEIKKEMDKSNRWRLVHEAVVNDCNFYLIYWLA